MSRYVPEACSLSDFRANATAYLKKMRKNNQPMLVTQNGKGAAVVLTPETYANLLDTIDLQQSRQQLEQSREDIRQGRYYTLDQVREHFAILSSALARKKKTIRKQ